MVLQLARQLERFVERYRRLPHLDGRAAEGSSVAAGQGGPDSAPERGQPHFGYRQDPQQVRTHADSYWDRWESGAIFKMTRSLETGAP
jgi:hypothetical protein